MKKFLHFVGMTFIVFAVTAIIGSTMAKADHNPPDHWLIAMDYDDRGKPFIQPENRPRQYATRDQCFKIGYALIDYIKQYHSERRVAVVCIHQEGAPLSAILEQVGRDFRRYFPPMDPAI